MKTCPNCGASMTDEEIFCGSCGERYQEPSAAPASFCPNCGEPIPAGSTVCPNCGGAEGGSPAEPAASAGGYEAPQPAWEPGATVPLSSVPGYTAPPAGKKARKVPKGAIIGAAAAVAVIGIVVAAVVLMNTLFAPPAKKFVSFQRQTVVDPVVNGVGVLSDTLNDLSTLSTDFTISASSGSRMIDRYLEDTSVGLQVNLGGDTRMVGADLTLLGSQVASGVMTYRDGTLGVYVPELDEHYYTADLMKLAEASGMADTSDLEGLNDLQFTKLPTETLKRALNTYLDIVLSTVTDENVTKEDSSVRRYVVEKGKTDATVYTFEPTAQDVEEMLLRLADAMEEDQVLHDLVRECLGRNEAFLNSLLAEQSEFDSYSQMLDEGLSYGAEALRDYAADCGEAVEDAEFRWVVAVSGGKVILNSIQFGGGDYQINLEFGDGAMAFYLYDEPSYKEYRVVRNVVELTYSEERGLFSGELTYAPSSDSESAGIRFSDVDLKKTSILGIPYGEYRTDIPSSGAPEIRFTVQAADGGSDHILSLDDIPIGGESQDLDLIIHTTDRASTLSVPKASRVDISDYDPEELQDLFYDLSSEAQDLLYDIQREFG